MQTEKVLDPCLKLFAQTGSDLADGEIAAIKLQERMERNGMEFDDLFDYLCEHEKDYGYQAAHFFHLMDRAQRVRQSNDACPDHDQTSTAPQESAPLRREVRAHTRASRTGKVFTVRDHWRNCRRRADRYDWRKDPCADPGDGHEWIAGHERWYCHTRQGRKIRVRGYWRRKASIALRKAA